MSKLIELNYNFNLRKFYEIKQKKQLGKYATEKILSDLPADIWLFIGGGSTTEYFFQRFIKQFMVKESRSRLVLTSNNLSILEPFRSACKYQRVEDVTLYFSGNKVDVKQNSLAPLEGCDSLSNQLLLMDCQATECPVSKENCPTTPTRKIAVISCARIWQENNGFHFRAFSKNHADIQKQICEAPDIYTYLIADDSKFDTADYSKKPFTGDCHFLTVSNEKNNPNLSLVFEYKSEAKSYTSGAIFSHLEEKFEEIKHKRPSIDMLASLEKWIGWLLYFFKKFTGA